MLYEEHELHSSYEVESKTYSQHFNRFQSQNTELHNTHLTPPCCNK